MYASESTTACTHSTLPNQPYRDRWVALSTKTRYHTPTAISPPPTTLPPPKSRQRSPRVTSASRYALSKRINAAGKVLFTCQNKFRGTPYEKDRYYDNDIVVYRLADVHLLKAELLCYLDGGNVAQAVGLMNKTRNRAGIGDYTGPTDLPSVQRAILDERFLELCFELKRCTDLMRAHAAGTINIYNEVPNLNGKSTPLYFPITPTMRDYNENLTQTEGY